MKDLPCFSKLISPFSSKIFFKSYWDKRHLYIKNTKNKNLQEIFSYQKLNFILNSQIYSLRPDDIRLTNQGNIFKTEDFVERSSHYVTAVRKPKEKIAIGKLNQHLHDGAALVISEIHESDIELQEFAHNLYKDIGLPVSISVSHSCKGNNTFKPHFDTTDIFVIQIHGEKKWTLDGYTPSPTSYRNEEIFTEIDVKNKDVVILSPGDVLYIPSGMWHDTTSVTKTSLSLSIAIHSKRNIDLAYSILNYYLSQNLLNDETLRKNLPVKEIVGSEKYLTATKSILTRIKMDIKDLLKEFNEEDLNELLRIINDNNVMNRGLSSSYNNRITCFKEIER